MASEEKLNVWKHEDGLMVGLRQTVAEIEAEGARPVNLRGRLTDLSLDEAVQIGLSGHDWKLGYKAWRYNLQLHGKEGNFTAVLDEHS
jgi:hypothetical protein